MPAATSKFFIASLAIFALEPSSILVFSFFILASVSTGVGAGFSSSTLGASTTVLVAVTAAAVFTSSFP